MPDREMSSVDLSPIASLVRPGREAALGVLTNRSMFKYTLHFCHLPIFKQFVKNTKILYKCPCLEKLKATSFLTVA